MARLTYRDLLQDSGEIIHYGEELCNASAIGNTMKVQEIISRHPELVKFQNKQGQTPLHTAAYGGHVGAVDALVTNDAPLERQDKEGQTPLASAVDGNEPKVVRYLLEAGSKINASNKMSFTPLYLATLHDQQKCVEILLERWPEACNINFKDSRGNTPLFIAIRMSNKPIIDLLVGHQKVDLTLKDSQEMNCLHYAALCGNSFAVERILKVAPDLINIPRSDGLTALHIAAINGRTDVVLTLVKQKEENGSGASVTIICYINIYIYIYLLAKNNCEKELKYMKDKTALLLAVEKQHAECVKALLDNGADVNAQDSRDQSCFHLVMVRSVSNQGAVSSVIFQLLLEREGADFTLKNNQGLSCLHFAAHSGNTPAIEKILEVVPWLINLPQNDGMTALHIAANKGFTDTVTSLAKKDNCSKGLKNNNGVTALHLAVVQMHYECIEILLNHGADVNAQDKEGNTSLHRCMMTATLDAKLRPTNQEEGDAVFSAVLKNDRPIIKFGVQTVLEKAPSLINSIATDGLTALHFAASNGKTDIVLTLIKQEKCKKDPKNLKEETPLHLAIQMGHFECADALIKNGADVNAQDKDGNTGLHRLMIQVSLQESLSTTPAGQDNCRKDAKRTDGRTALHLAVEFCRYQCVQILLDNGADVNAQDKEGNTSLHLIVDLIFKNPANSTANMKDGGKVSVLNIAKDDQKIIELLVQHPNADLRLENDEDFNCLQYAALKNNSFAVDTMLKFNPSLINTTGSEDLTALHIAASNGFVQVLSALLEEKTCRKDIKSVSGQTALHLAVEKCQFECTKALLESDADVNAQDIHGNSSLHLVIEKVSLKNISMVTTKSDDGDPQKLLVTFKNNKQVIKLLVNHPKVDLTLRNKSDFNCLHLAAINGNTFAIRSILEANPSLVKSVFGKDRSTALHLAALNGHTDVVAALCEHDMCETDHPNANGQTALHVATDCCNRKIVEILLNKGVNVNAQDKDGDTCMHLLMSKALKKEAPASLDIQHITTLFVEHQNIDLLLTNKKGDTSLHCAAFVGNNDAVEKTLKVTPSVINITSQTFTALHIASLYGKADVVQTLAKQPNCITDRQNGNGQTALHLAIDKSHYKCIEALVTNGADVNTQDKDGNTSLHLVMMKETTREMLISTSREQLADLAKTIEEEGGIRDARTNLVALIISLLKHGANVRKMNSKEKDVLHLCPNADVESFLAEFGGIRKVTEASN
ncbi:serine/threonine-protein phosphatase 6 regulatory ankyrin repeat subunit B-like [Patiria miniata]|uniref:Uncharacterized protein n=1 Tax=Patiria miniata TaxID=46514 RepID=A0A914ABG6_PATMI|nr:serine/threonine-protein phosphatase 6 regulatory ankyrin repeat subunit B-like [Patiria miniata]